MNDLEQMAEEWACNYGVPHTKRECPAWVYDAMAYKAGYEASCKNSEKYISEKLAENQKLKERVGIAMLALEDIVAKLDRNYPTYPELRAERALDEMDKV